MAQRGGGHLPPSVQRTQQRVGGHPNVVEEHLGEIGVAVERDERTCLDAGQRHVDDQARDALVLGGVGVGAHTELTPIRAMSQRCPDLLAVDDVLVAVQHRAGAQRGEIRPGFRLRHALAPDVVGAHHPGEQLALLGIRAVLHDRGRDVVHPDHVERHRRPRMDGLLRVGELLQHGGSAAAVLLRP